MDRKQALLEWVASRRKAIVAAVVAYAVARLSRDGMDLGPEQVDLLTTGLTAVLVYLVPNK
jgi:hypothetical protein